MNRDELERKMDDQTEPNYDLRLPEFDPDFRLTAAERETLDSNYDLDALERLLAMMQPGQRHLVLRGFRRPELGAHKELIYIGDPALQQALGEVWMPVLQRYYSTEALLHPTMARWPGVEAELRRRGVSSGHSDDRSVASDG